MGKLIPFNVPYVPEVSKKYVLKALESSHHQGDGPFTAKASKMVSDLVGGGHVLLTPSCTHALEMASMLINIGPGDEVILPSYTFTSAANAVTKFGATPVFVDIEMQTKGIDVNQVREAITPKTKAISWVNYAGVAPDIEALQCIAKEFNLILIEDNAHGLGGSFNGKPLGSFGDFATQSFHATKNIQCGEGGALVINKSEFIGRAEIIREKGTDRSKFVRGEIQKYQWVDRGSSYLLAESLSAVLLGQLESFSDIQSQRRKIASKYQIEILRNQSFAISDSTIEAAHIVYLQFKNKAIMSKIKDQLNSEEIMASSHYHCLDSSWYWKRHKRKFKQNPKAEQVATTLLRLPIWYQMTDLELSQVIEVTNHILAKNLK